MSTILRHVLLVLALAGFVGTLGCQKQTGEGGEAETGTVEDTTMMAPPPPPAGETGMTDTTMGMESDTAMAHDSM